jgi:hypothetical protein
MSFLQAFPQRKFCAAGETVGATAPGRSDVLGGQLGAEPERNGAGSGAQRPRRQPPTRVFLVTTAKSGPGITMSGTHRRPGCLSLGPAG